MPPSENPSAADNQQETPNSHAEGRKSGRIHKIVRSSRRLSDVVLPPSQVQREVWENEEEVRKAAQRAEEEGD